jgi:hypothetical protein
METGYDAREIVMNDVNNKECPYCTTSYSSHSVLVRHMRKTKCGVSNDPKSSISDKPNVELDSEKDTLNDLSKLVTQLSQTIIQMKVDYDQKLNKIMDDLEVNRYDRQPSLSNNLNVLCLTGEEDYCKELLIRGDSKKTLTYIKHCALGKLASDCRLLIKVCGLDTNQPTIVYENKGKTKIAYYNKERKLKIESNLDTIAEKLALNLVNTYFSLSNHVKNNDGSFKKITFDDPYLPIIEDHDISIINKHVYALKEKKYQKELLKALPIPFRGDIES